MLQGEGRDGAALEHTAKIQAHNGLVHLCWTGCINEF